jgi:hypothetical protein
MSILKSVLTTKRIKKEVVSDTKMSKIYFLGLLILKNPENKNNDKTIEKSSKFIIFYSIIKAKT